MTLFAGIDLGTGGARCLVADETGARVAFGERAWSYTTDANGFATLDARAALDAIHGALADACDGRAITAAGVTAQRTGVVFLDGESELVVSPNADGRGALHGVKMERDHGALVYEKAGRLPVLIYLPARLAWFRSEQPDVYARITYALSLSDWLAWCMTGARRTEPTQAAETLCFDVSEGSWSPALCDALGVKGELLAELGEPGEPAGECRDGILKGVPIVAAGADTQVSALALGVTEPGEAIVVAGTTMICERVTDRPEPDASRRLWTSPHALLGRFVSESHCGEAGAALAWLSETLREPVATLARDAVSAPPGASGVVFVDPQPSNASDFALVRRGGFTFPVPLLALGRDRAHLARAALEGIAFAAAAGIEQLGVVDSVAAAGGVTRSSVFTDALSGAIQRPVRVATEPHGSALGAAIAAAAQHFGGVREAANAMHDRGREVTPDASHGYPSHQAAWRAAAAGFDSQALKVSML